MGCQTFVMKISLCTLLVVISINDAAIGAQPIVGPATVVDGDTMDVNGTRIRLHGIDAPEGGQTCHRASSATWDCGRESAQALARFMGRSPVRCDGKGQDRYGRTVAVCYRGGADINQWMVANGWAVAFRQYSLAYVNVEESARRARLGLWAGTFEMPWDWRRAKRH